MTDLASGLGSIIGGGNAISSLSGGINSMTGLLGVGGAALAPYNISGIGTLPQTNALLTSEQWSPFVGSRRVDAPTNPVDFSSFMSANGGSATAPSFEDFAKDYTLSPGAKFALDTAETEQNAGAAARGGFYSGANMRANDTIAEGIANQDLLSQYQAVLSGHQSDINSYTANIAGQQQDFAQREQSFQNMFNQETLGEKSAASTALLAGSGASSLGSLFGQQANAQASKGSGVGGLVGSLLTK